jgi:dihydrofolate synthase / folylpolyglutamate synthase
MDYAEALAYLDTFVNLERGALDRAARAVISLEPVRSLAALLGDPQLRFPAIHVAGTKGKGSTCAFAESMLRAAGLKTGLYTSPHLQDVRERIQVNGARIPAESFAALMTQLRPILEDRRDPPAGVRRPTYFEILTHLAFLFFAEQKVDVAIVEVGLGGRLDATTIVRPLACGITNISYDHQAILGETLELIAREKAGILKAGVPLVLANHPSERVAAQDEVLSVAKAVGAPVCGPHRVAFEGDTCRTELADGRAFECRLPLRGAFQGENWAVAVELADTAHRALRGNAIDPDCVKRGTRAVKWPGRLEALRLDGGQSGERKRRSVYLDGAHNLDSVAHALDALHPALVLFACAKDKNIDSMLETMARRESVHEIVFSQVEYGRASSSADLLQRWQRISQKPARAIQPLAAALEDVLARSADGETVLALGSLYLVGALREILMADGYSSELDRVPRRGASM